MTSRLGLTRCIALIVGALAVGGCEFDSPTLEPEPVPAVPDPDTDPGLEPAPAPVGPPSDAWWDDAFDFRVKITFDNKTRDENLGNVPVLVKLDGSRISYGNTQPDGRDVRFIDADGMTELDYEVERWNPSGLSYLWVRVPRIDASSDEDHMYMYYGNAGAPTAANPSEVWKPASYLGVYHLSDSLGSNTDAIRDSTNQGVNGSDLQRLDSADTEDGIAASAIRFGDKSDRVSIHDSESFAVYQNKWRTMEVWFKASPGNRGRQIFFKEIGCRGWTVSLDSSGVLNGSFGTTLTSSGNCQFNGFQYTSFKAAQPTRQDDDKWHYAAFVLDREVGKGQFYIDGALAAEQNVPTDRNGVGAIDTQIGHSFDDNQTFEGLIDETRISSGTRSAIWVAVQHASVTDSLLQYTAAEPRPE